MKRVLLLIPDTVTFETLTAQQQEAIRGVFGQWFMPMTGTTPKDGYQICDAACLDAFDPAHMSQYGFNWSIIGQWRFDEGATELVTITPLNEAELLKRLPLEYDDEGNALPHVLKIPSNFYGWPPIVI